MCAKIWFSHDVVRRARNSFPSIWYIFGRRILFLAHTVVIRCSSSGSTADRQQQPPPKPLGGISINFTRIICGWSPFKVVKRFPLHAEILLSWQTKKIIFKIMSKTSGQISNYLVHVTLRRPNLYQNCSNYFNWLKIWPPGGVASFSYVNIGDFLSEIARPSAGTWNTLFDRVSHKRLPISNYIMWHMHLQKLLTV